MLSEIKGKLDEKLEETLESEKLPGLSVCITDQNFNHWEQVYGVQLASTKNPLQTQHCFRAGSTTKTMIAVILMQLREEGKLSLDQTIESLLPELVPNGEGISIRQLMNHRSGFEDYLWVQDNGRPMISKFKTHPNDRFTPEQLVEKGTNAPVHFQPGAGYYYSNTNYIILGILIEELTGDSIQDVLKERIITPLQLSQTYFPTDNEIKVPYAVGHSKLDDNLQVTEHIESEIENLNVSLAWSAGALISTPMDLNLFLAGLFSNKLLSEESLKEMIQFQPTNDEGLSYGLGLYRFEFNNAVAYGHPGGIPGYETVMLHVPKDRIYISIMINQMPSNALKIAEKVYNHYSES
ncbi:serine hydrolase domain-containing protein [Pseudalkalibacillus decolorationis]|uniref:serine hydrolase domain-containing protein n=1 Tax=Pseudalkalibacillus decolorationis TaxID=163879 RepID=UPI002149345F|nr:serine hydrolase domain-containing protein [Pseudalkalibacillus decolorationis]